MGAGASKLLSVFIVWCMVLSSFAGLLVLAIPGAGQALAPSENENGDRFYGSDYENTSWYVSGLMNLNGNLTIGAGGTVVVENGILNFESYQTDTVSRLHHLTVEDGGTLILLNSNLTTEPTLYEEAFDALGVLVRNGGKLIANDSSLDFQGKLLFDYATFIANRTRIKGPLVTAVSSDIQLYDSSISSIPGKPTSLAEVYAYPFATSYNDTIDVDYTLERNADPLRCVVPDNDAANLTTSGSGYVAIGSTENMVISGFDIGGLVFDAGEAKSVRLMAEYRTSDLFEVMDSPDTFYYFTYLDPTPDQATNMEVVPTYEGYEPPLTNTDKVLSQDLTFLGLSSIDLSMLSVTFTNNQVEDVFIDRVWLEVVLTVPAYSNITIAGTSELTAVNTKLEVNNLNYTTPGYKKLVVTDLATANLYGVEIADEYVKNGMGPFVTVRKNLTFKPTMQGDDDNTSEDVYNLLTSDNIYYEVNNNETLHILVLNDTNIKGKIHSALLSVESRCGSGYNSSNYIQWNITGLPLYNTSIQINSISELTSSYQLLPQFLTKISQLSQLNIIFSNPDTKLVVFDYIEVEVELDPTINIYRWVDISVVDSNGLPVSEAMINATDLTGRSPIYFYDSSESAVPPQEILDYLGRNSTNYILTNESGLLALPLLTDVITEDWNPNSYPMEPYRINATYFNATYIPFPSDVQYTEFDPYPDLIKQRMAMPLVIDRLVLQLPDIAVIGFATDPETIYQGDEVELSFTVVNYGLTTASRFVISVRDVLGNQTHYLDNITVTNLLHGESRTIVVNWGSALTLPGNHNIVITADSLYQIREGINEANNVLSVQVQVLAFLPDLEITSASIAFSQAQGAANHPMYINVTVSNILGREAAYGAKVAFYLGYPSAGRNPENQTTIDVPSGGSSIVSFLWAPTQIGNYSIYVWVNYDGAISEYSHSNNMASRFLEVILEASGRDWVVTTECTMTALTFTWQHNIIVEDNGHLTFDGTTICMLENRTQTETGITQIVITQIVVRDNGVLVLNDAVLNADFNMKVYLFDNARLYLNGSTLEQNIVLIMDDTSQVFMESSKVKGQMSAPSTASVKLVAFNTTFDHAISDFGGSSVAILTGASINGIAPVSPKDDAIVYLYSWIVVKVFDGTGEHALAGVHVEARAFPSTPYFTGTTDPNGTVMVQALSAIVSASGHQLFGIYVLNATYWYDGVRYDSPESPTWTVSVIYHPMLSLVRSDVLTERTIPGAKPDIDPPFTVSNRTSLRGSVVVLSTTVRNAGVVTAYDITVRFRDNTTGWYVDRVIESLAPQAEIDVSVNWTANYPLGNHTLSVMVDPLNKIPELNEGNNFNSTTVTVLGVPDMAIVPADVVIDPSIPERDRRTSIIVHISNLGDFTASAFNVSFYDGDDLIGNVSMPNIPIGQKGVASITWTPTTAGPHSIKVIVDEKNAIVEGSKDNNMVEVETNVADYPDLITIDLNFLINGMAGNEANLDDEIQIVTVVHNDGESSASGFNVVFWLNGESVIGVVPVTRLDAKTATTVSLDWDPSTMMNISQRNNITILVVVNPGTNTTYTHIHEIDDPLNNNNKAHQNLLVKDNRPDIAITDVMIQSNDANVTSGTQGERIKISFTVKNVGLVDATNINVGVYLESNGRLVLFEENRNIAEGGTVKYTVTWTVNVSKAEYTLSINTDVGLDANPDDNEYRIPFEVVALNPNIDLELSKVNYAPGDAIIVNGQVTQGDHHAPLTGLTVKAVLTDATGLPLSIEQTVKTDEEGRFYAVVQVPSGKEGNHLLKVTVAHSEGNFSATNDIKIIAPFTPQSIPTWVYLLIVAIVIAVIVIFSIYLYKVGLGRMVECGNCGALIPEVSKHCPKCGVEFEADTAKCSECGAWIPVKAESCPECGAKFLTEPLEGEEGSGYIETMRKQYDDYIEGFRSQAKAALGNKYSEEKFQEWLKTEPNFLPFEEWLRKEEMGRKSGVFACPACGTLNPKDAKVCNRCGTVFEQPKAEPQAPKAEEKEKKGTFRRIVRRASEPKPEKPSQAEAPSKAEEGKEASKPGEGERPK